MKTITLFVSLCIFSSSTLAYNDLSDTGLFDHFSDQISHSHQKPTFFRDGLHRDRQHEKLNAKSHWARFRPLFAKYSPQYPLWSDGTIKRRWVYLPGGSKIDTADADAWIFPVGTKLWKEFSVQEGRKLRKLETRLLEKVDEDQWNMETYVWNEQQTRAILAPDEGIKNAYPLGNGKFYDIPSKHDCEFCHSKAALDNGPIVTPVLGFSALQLSDDRDENAIHGEPLNGRMLTLSVLQNLGKTSTILDEMPTIPESDLAPLQRQVFGYLHGNCAHCHNESGLAEFTNTTNFFHSVKAKFVQQSGTYQTALGKTITDYLRPNGSPEYIIKPGNAAESALIYRMTEEHEEYTFEVPPWHHSAGFSLTVDVKMPFVGTNVIDWEAVDIITDYINHLPN